MLPHGPQRAQDVTDVATSASQTRQGAEETMRSADELNGLATGLRELVGRFTL